jgi:hypothetical protein
MSILQVDTFARIAEIDRLKLFHSEITALGVSDKKRKSVTLMLEDHIKRIEEEIDPKDPEVLLQVQLEGKFGKSLGPLTDNALGAFGIRRKEKSEE